MIVTFLLSFAVSSLLLAIIMLWRNNRVFRYRMYLGDEVSRQAKRDINLGRPWEWRYTVLNSVSYYAMVYKFWRRLPSFYLDTDFIEPSWPY